MTTEKKDVDVAKVMAAKIERIVETVQGKLNKNGNSLEEQLFRHYQRCFLYLEEEGKAEGRPKWMKVFDICAHDAHKRCAELKTQYDGIKSQVKAMQEKTAKEASDATKAKEEAKTAKKAEKEAAKAAEKKAKAEAKAKAKAEKAAKKAANPGNKSTKKAKKKSASKAKAKS